LAAVGVAAINLSTLILADRPGLAEYTITRMIGSLMLGNNTTGTTARAQVLAGITTTTDVQTVSQIPDPFNEPHADWMWWRGTYLMRSDIDTGDKAVRLDFDIRSQRKQRELERTFHLIISNRGVVSIEFGLHLSALLKL